MTTILEVQDIAFERGGKCNMVCCIDVLEKQEYSISFNFKRR